MTYTLTAHPNTIVRDEDGAFIPTDPDNVDYQDYLAWLDEGNEPTPYTPPPAAEEDFQWLKRRRLIIRGRSPTLAATPRRGATSLIKPSMRSIASFTPINSESAGFADRFRLDVRGRDGAAELVDLRRLVAADDGRDL